MAYRISKGLESDGQGLMGFPGGAVVKIHLPVQEMQQTRVQSLGQADPLEKGMATHSSILA